jgi:hypothetical protein
MESHCILSYQERIIGEVCCGFSLLNLIHRPEVTFLEKGKVFQYLAKRRFIAAFSGQIIS